MGMCLGLHDLFKFWEMTISETVQDSDIATMED